MTATRILFAAVLLAAGLTACSQPTALATDLAHRKIKVTTTVGMITDIVRNVGGERVEVAGLMGPGVDPHLYKPSARDVNRLDEADIIFYGGLELEGRMTDLFEKMARSGQ
ncbi:MAG: metal ABC transporter solute-binding protein, Zn/Mn family, partial [Candidatus Roseilinea sp.]|uniref:metal ABC transporter solute-binding protein, Zn/Mn family n=1 Tax=Candidatus Roseilinea sp. TaxID=2838777 RepID=UPI00404912C1